MDFGNLHLQVTLPMSFVGHGVFPSAEFEHFELSSLDGPSYLGHDFRARQDRGANMGSLVIFDQQNLVQFYSILPLGELAPFDINKIALAEKVLFSAVFYDCVHRKLQKSGYFAKFRPWPFDQSAGMLY